MFSKRYSGLRPYVPGEQPKDRPYIKLNANENPYPPSPAVKRALEAFDPARLALYPDPDANELRASIAAMVGHGATSDMIFAGNGSDEVLSFVFYALFDSDKPLHFPEHTYSFYPVYAGYYGIPFVKTRLKPDFSIDADALVEGESSGIIFANPNAPTGIFMGIEDVRSILVRYPADRAVVVDEAYIDFGGETVVPLIREFPNLVVIRTFSKSGCFAGARLGFVVANPEVIRAILTVKNSFNHFPVDALTQTIGIAACSDPDYYRSINGRIMRTRDAFSSGLVSSGWDVLPSKTNFVFARKPGRTGREVYEAIKKEGILVRHFDIPGISDFVRISIGTEGDMEALLAVMKRI